MNKTSINKDFANDLERNHQVQVSPADRESAEKMLGKGAVKFRLDRAGTRKLLKRHKV